MATYKKYDTATKGERWEVAYRNAQHPKGTTKGGFLRKADAKAWYETHVLVAGHTGAFVSPSKGKTTVASLYPGWIARKKAELARSSWEPLDREWRNFVEKRWGGVAVAKIETLDVETWVAELLTMPRTNKAGKVIADGYSSTVVNRCHTILRGVLDDAVKAKRLAVNPCRATDNLPPIGAKRHVYLEAADVARLATEAGAATAHNATPVQNQAVIYMLTYTGIRWGELIGIRVREIGFLTRKLNIVENAVELDDGTYQVGFPKGRKPRTISLPAFLMPMLSVLCEGKGRNDLVFGDGQHYLKRPKGSTSWYAGALRRAGLEPITIHDLRHTFASLCANRGMSIMAVSRMMGHAKPSITLNTYSTLFERSLDAVAAELDEIFASAERGQSVGFRPESCPECGQSIAS